MTLERILWLLPVLFVLHDGEEILTWRWWMERKGQHIFSFRSTPMATSDWAAGGTGQMAIAVLVVGALLTTGTIQSVLALRAGGRPYLAGALLAIWLVHAGIHVAASIYHRMYSPGVVTAVLICVPHGLYAYQRLLGAGVLTWPQILISGAVGLALAPLMLRLAHTAGTHLIKRGPAGKTMVK